MIIHFDRDSVCMGDDCESHQIDFEVDDSIVLSMFIKSFLINQLALISGGRATWILLVKTNDTSYRNIAVIAQQWNSPKLLIHDCKLNELSTKDDVINIIALYKAQVDPDTVYSEMNRIKNR